MRFLKKLLIKMQSNTFIFHFLVFRAFWKGLSRKIFFSRAYIGAFWPWSRAFLGPKYWSHWVQGLFLVPSSNDRPSNDGEVGHEDGEDAQNLPPPRSPQCLDSWSSENEKEANRTCVSWLSQGTAESLSTLTAFKDPYIVASAKMKMVLVLHSYV